MWGDGGCISLAGVDSLCREKIRGNLQRSAGASLWGVPGGRLPALEVFGTVKIEEEGNCFPPLHLPNFSINVSSTH